MRIRTVGFLLLIQQLAIGQGFSRFQQELNSIDSLLQKTKSYKEQVKGEQLQKYQQKKQELSVRTDTLHSWQRFILLTKLLEFVRDNHLGFYQRGNNSEWPVVNWNLDSLKVVLSEKSADEIEGIYQYGEDYQMGLVKTGERDYQGIVLDSKVPGKKPGQQIAWLKEKGRNRFAAVYLHPLTNNLLYYPIERSADQQLLFSKFYQSNYNGVYNKNPDGVDFVNLPDTSRPFLLTEPYPSVQYVRVSSFSNNGNLRKQSDSLIQLVNNTAVQPYTILDLRNNTGGSAGMSKPYIKWVNRVRKKSNVVILTNANTISQGEITANRLSKLKGVVLAGQQTKGMLAYGSNYGKHIAIAGGEFVFYPTDMRTPGLLQFEDVGILPNLPLSNKEDWLEQIYNYWKLK
ncbi:S41 family peptidase [Flavihumibacter sp. UBA7668]|uniref:S41 family peptidase n=1 Tax=Flavihumibacter sp. UBA7668 TaxID=1946542 RepID=UPI0025C19F95|nr:S41 family peptidase [Flavihumibacter sp. UBA7668]